MQISEDELFELESSLRNFFLKEKSAAASSQVNLSYKLMKYRGLSFSLDVRNAQNSTFTVKIGALECTFSAKNGNRLSGSLGGDEKIVYKWFLFGNVQEQMTATLRRKDFNFPKKTDAPEDVGLS